MANGIAARKLGYTWDDYRSWNDHERWQLMAGEPFAMSPAPSTRHQGIVVALTRHWRSKSRAVPAAFLFPPSMSGWSREDRVSSATLRGLSVDLSRVFDFPLEPGEEIAMVKEGRPPGRAARPAGT